MNNTKKIRVSIGIFAHNEEQNIGRAIKSVIASKTDEVVIDQIVVVSSGSIDATNSITRSWLKLDKRVTLVTQSERNGKSSAVNLFIHRATSPILITMSADLTVASRAIEEIVLPFFDPGIGMVGAHPVPKQSKAGQINREIELLWQLHHEISMIKPKCGEMVAFRNIVRQIPAESAVDEATLEVMLTLLGYTISYAPKALVYNRGPQTIWEYVVQRRRVHAGHEWVQEKYNYKVVTIMPRMLLTVVANHLSRQPGDIIVITRLILLEIVARFMGSVDYYVFGRNPYKWQMIKR